MGRKALYCCVAFLSGSVVLVYLFAYVDLGHVQKTVKNAVSSISHMHIVFDTDDKVQSSKEGDTPLKFQQSPKSVTSLPPSSVIMTPETTTTRTETSTSVMDIFDSVTKDVLTEYSKEGSKMTTANPDTTSNEINLFSVTTKTLRRPWTRAPPSTGASTVSLSSTPNDSKTATKVFHTTHDVKTEEINTHKTLLGKDAARIYERKATVFFLVTTI